MHFSRLLFFAAILSASACLLPACKKFNQVPLTTGASYFRVFNGLTNFSHYDGDLVVYLQNRPVSARISVFVDPATDSNGILNTAAIADNLYPKTYFYTPYPDKAGNAVFFDPDYPGSKVVEVSPVVNGIDLSRWATISSGKHRFVFTALPTGQTSAGQINSIRFNTLTDTTIDMSPGHYYTLQPINNGTGFQLYEREEDFEHIHPDTSKINFRILNLCKSNQVLPDTFDVYYRYHYFNDATYTSPYNPNHPLYHVEYDDSVNRFLSTVTKRFPGSPADAPYYSVPLPPVDSSYWIDGSLKAAAFRPSLVITLCSHGQQPPLIPYQNATLGVDFLLQFVCTENFVNIANVAASASNFIPDSLAYYYYNVPSSQYAFYNIGSTLNNPYPSTAVPVAGELWQYNFISGLSPRRQPLISTIELMDNYFTPGNNPPSNSFNVDNSSVRIYVIGAEGQYGNPYN